MICEGKFFLFLVTENVTLFVRITVECSGMNSVWAGWGNVGLAVLICCKLKNRYDFALKCCSHDAGCCRLVLV